MFKGKLVYALPENRKEIEARLKRDNPAAKVKPNATLDSFYS